MFTWPCHVVISVPDEPTLVRVHVQSVMRDLVTSKVPDRRAWSLAKCLQAVADNGRGVIVLLARAEAPEQLLASIDMALGEDVPAVAVPPIPIPLWAWARRSSRTSG